MVPLTSLWIPILVSAVLVFVVSSVIHMLLPVHKNDFRKLPKEDEALEAMGKLGLTPGDYMFPLCSSMGEMKDPAFLGKMEKGPVGVLTVMPSGPPAMGRRSCIFRPRPVCAMAPRCGTDLRPQAAVLAGQPRRAGTEGGGPHDSAGTQYEP